MRTIEEIKADFVADLNKWQAFIYEYELDTLRKQPKTGEWSIGQVVNHFVIETDWYFSQARKALAETKNLHKSKSPEITKWFAAKSFPNKRFKGPEDMDEPIQPKSANELTDKIQKLTTQMLALANTISEQKSEGKAEHPGHGFLTATEWLQYAEMHCRHHFKQKERIDSIIQPIKKP